MFFVCFGFRVAKREKSSRDCRASRNGAINSPINCLLTARFLSDFQPGKTTPIRPVTVTKLSSFRQGIGQVYLKCLWLEWVQIINRNQFLNFNKVRFLERKINQSYRGYKYDTNITHHMSNT